MPTGIRIPQRIVERIRIAVEALRVRRVGDDDACIADACIAVSACKKRPSAGLPAPRPARRAWPGVVPRVVKDLPNRRVLTVTSTPKQMESF